MAKYYHGNINRAKYRKLMCLFEQATFTLQERYRPISVILDGLDLNLPTPHGERKDLTSTRSNYGIRNVGKRAAMLREALDDKYG